MAYDEILASAIDAIGNTPLVALDRLCANHDGRILAKLEFANPGFSKKDRAARMIIDEAERAGELEPGQTVVELTSGNMGTGLAIVCAIRRYPFVAVMSRGNSVERARMMEALGAEVVLVEQAPGSTPGQVSGADLARVEQETARITIARAAFRADQFVRDGNPLAHYRHTGPEIWRQSGGHVTHFCDFVGSGGSYAGITRYLKQQDAGIACYIVEPQGAAVLAHGAAENPDHPIQGGGYSMPDLKFLDKVPVDGYLGVSGRQARAAARDLARVEGIFGGYSSGANVAAALELLDGPARGGVVAVLICDSGLKYLSTDLWPSADSKD
ncbi:MAG: PLP-dependent cysteine synthase family protein [Gammaproteobacteria bacterium]|nr:PLP-dependent cysteine synthase family protein [Gammaproteobacteria bacterium]MDH3536518.1 PLP-dependent cysteine synthase family protein [Gammaproteobacteria bacterium]